MGRDALIDYLKSCGWYPWYSENYWCHPTKTTVDRSRQDPTNYGMSVEDAYDFEINNRKPFSGQFLGTYW